MNRAFALGLISLAVSATTTFACDDSGNKDEAAKAPPPPTTGGELGQAEFTYKCLLISDPSCDNDALGTGAGGGEGHFPKIATGSRFGATWVTIDGKPTNPPLVLTTLHPGFATVDQDGNVTAVKAGESSIGLLIGPQMYDVLDINVVDPILKVDSAQPQGEFTDIKVSGGKVVAKGTFTFRFRVAPSAVDGTILAGSFPCMWTTSDKDIANITTDPTDNIVTIVSGPKQGTATIHVTLGPMVTDIPITLGS
jgi:hypothetical protein